MIIHDVEQGSDEWLKLRAGKPTSSRFESLVTSTGQKSDGFKEYAEFLATEVMADGPINDGWKGNKYTERGKELEDAARAEYEMTHQVQIEQVGFITDDLMRWGTSTDGLVGGDGGVEIKCQIATRFFKTLLYWKRYQKFPPPYVAQVQGELLITGRKWFDLVVYHPQFEMLVIRAKPEPKIQAALAEQLKAVVAERNNLVKLARAA